MADRLTVAKKRQHRQRQHFFTTALRATAAFKLGCNDPSILPPSRQLCNQHPAHRAIKHLLLVASDPSATVQTPRLEGGKLYYRMRRCQTSWDASWNALDRLRGTSCAMPKWSSHNYVLAGV